MSKDRASGCVFVAPEAAVVSASTHMPWVGHVLGGPGQASETPHCKCKVSRYQLEVSSTPVRCHGDEQSACVRACVNLQMTSLIPMRLHC